MFLKDSELRESVTGVREAGDGQDGGEAEDKLISLAQGQENQRGGRVWGIRWVREMRMLVVLRIQVTRDL